MDNQDATPLNGLPGRVFGDKEHSKKASYTACKRSKEKFD